MVLSNKLRVNLWTLDIQHHPILLLPGVSGDPSGPRWSYKLILPDGFRGCHGVFHFSNEPPPWEESLIGSCKRLQENTSWADRLAQPKTRKYELVQLQAMTRFPFGPLVGVCAPGCTWEALPWHVCFARLLFLPLWINKPSIHRPKKRLL